MAIVRVGRADQGLATVEATDGHAGSDVGVGAGNAQAGLGIAVFATVSGAGGVALFADRAEFAQRDALVAVLTAD